MSNNRIRNNKYIKETDILRTMPHQLSSEFLNGIAYFKGNKLLKPYNSYTNERRIFTPEEMEERIMKMKENIK
jgi:hypothetical protein